VLLSLVDVFRCPADHEEMALVLSVDAWRDTRIDRGVLGCPRCLARYPIANGVVDFRRTPIPGALLTRESPLAPDEGERLQALLGLAEPGGVILLTGRYAIHADAVASLIDVTCLLVGASGAHPNCVGIEIDASIPLAPRSVRAAAIDDTTFERSLLAEVAGVVKPGGRILSPAGVPAPEAVTILAADHRDWVGQVHGSPDVVTLRRSGANIVA
jgi:uncharacterized protein YbaR (Trm112 family)